MSFNLRYYFLVSDNKQRNYNSMSGPPSKFVVVCTVLAGPCDEAPSVCARLLILSSVLLVLLTLPFSLCCVIKVVQVSAVLAMTVETETETV